MRHYATRGSTGENSEGRRFAAERITETDRGKKIAKGPCSFTLYGPFFGTKEAAASMPQRLLTMKTILFSRFSKRKEFLSLNTNGVPVR